jgi:hypothetical protein
MRFKWVNAFQALFATSGRPRALSLRHRILSGLQAIARRGQFALYLLRWHRARNRGRLIAIQIRRVAATVPLGFDRIDR